MVEGYNISLSFGGKTIVGRTSDSLSISAQTKESITKDDAGVKRIRVTGHEVTFSVSALLEVGNNAATKMDRDDVIELANKVGSEAEVAVVYSCTGGDSYGGTAVITSYSESSEADPDSDSTISLNLQIVGAFTKQS